MSRPYRSPEQILALEASLALRLAAEADSTAQTYRIAHLNAEAIQGAANVFCPWHRRPLLWTFSPN